MGALRKRDVAERLRLYVDVDPVTGCHNWTRNKNHLGYGQMSVGGRKAKPHRVAYEMARGPIPDGMVLDHLCRNPCCCNPDHLEPVTHLENVRRGAAVRTHCVYGHPFSGDNLRYDKNGRRLCVTCRRAASAQQYDKRRHPRVLMPVTLSRRPFRTDLEKVRSAVALANEVGLRAAATRLGLDKGLLSRWRRKLSALEAAQ